MLWFVVEHVDCLMEEISGICIVLEMRNFVIRVPLFSFFFFFFLNFIPAIFVILQCISFCLGTGRIPFSYLEDIHMRFMKNYGRVANYAPAYAMNDEFSRVLHQQMEFFSSNPSADTLNRVRGEVGEASIFYLCCKFAFCFFFFFDRG